MDWTEVKITVPAADTDRAADIANMVVPYGIYIEDYSDLMEGAREIAHIDLIDEELLARDRTRTIIHVYISPEDSPAEAVAFLRERYTAEGIDHEVLTGEVSEDDWANNWKKYFKQFYVDDILIIPSWEEVKEEDKDKMIIHIDPGTVPLLARVCMKRPSCVSVS